MGPLSDKARPHWWPQKDWEYWKLLKALDDLYISRNIPNGLVWRMPEDLMWLPNDLKDLSRHHISETINRLIEAVCINFNVIHPKAPSHPLNQRPGVKKSLSDWGKKMDAKLCRLNN